MTAEEFRRVTEVTYLGYVHGTLAALRRMLPRDRGVDRPGRLGAGLPRHPAAGGLLRGQARHPGLHRVAALRAAPRRQQRAGDDGAAAGAEHAAVRLGQDAGCRDKPQPVPPIYQPEVAAEAIVWTRADHDRRELRGRLAHRQGDRSATSSRPASRDRYLARAAATTRSRRDEPGADRAGDNLSSRCPATTARTAASGPVVRDQRHCPRPRGRRSRSREPSPASVPASSA